MNLVRFALACMCEMPSSAAGMARVTTVFALEAWMAGFPAAEAFSSTGIVVL